jgi:hypothetical protein
MTTTTTTTTTIIIIIIIIILFLSLVLHSSQMVNYRYSTNSTTRTSIVYSNSIRGQDNGY